MSQAPKKDVRPTPAQWQAIRELDKHLSVSAGAGAGKTWVLTERYTAMLAGRPLVKPPHELEAAEAARPAGDPSRPAQIVAITFTKEAAGEMKARIRDRLSQWKAEAPTDQQRDIGLLKEEVERATITTIHGYCSELLREYPVEAGLDPHFAVLEDSEARFLLDESIREALDAGLAREDDAVIRLITEYGYTPLVEHLTRFYPTVREHTEDFQHMGAETVQKLSALQAQLPERVDRLETYLQHIGALDLSARDTSKGSAKKAHEVQQALPVILQDLQEWRANNWAFRPEIIERINQLQNGWGVLIKELKEIVNPMKALLQELQGYIVPDGLLTAVQDVCFALSDIHTLYSARKATAQALDFTDLQNLAVRLLAHPAVQKRQAARLRFLMVDEFQDTNPVQKKLLDALTAGNDDLRLFVVGDAKQSIYRFRGADLEVFLQTQDQVRQSGGEHLSLAHNFRTQSPIISFVNRLFARLMPEQENGPRYATQYEPMVPTRDASHPQPMVELLHLQPLEDAASGKLREAKTIAARIQQLVENEELIPSGDGTLRRVQYRDITLLFSAMTHVSVYEHALQAAGIPYYIIGSRHFFRRQEVIDLALLLQAVVEGRDIIPLIGALRSPLFGVSDEAFFHLGKKGLLLADWTRTTNWEQIAPDDQTKLLRAQSFLHQWRREKTYKSAGDLLTAILEQTGYEQTLLLTFGGTQKAGNVRKLLDLTYDQPAERQAVLPFLDYLRRMIEESIDEEDAQVESDNADVVKIMTVHKSKGLEFPVVILPDAARQFNTSGDGKFHYDPDIGLAVLFTENEPWNDFGFTPALKELDKQKAKEEERRKLYVAMTRARDYLLLAATRDEPSKKVTLDSTRWFDWLIAAMADGVLSQMEGNILAEWPEVKWTNGETLLKEEEEGQDAAKVGVASEQGSVAEVFTALKEVAAARSAGELEQGSGTATFDALTELAALGPEARRAHQQTAFPLLTPLRPEPGTGKGLLLSVSALLTYLSCPRQYLYRYEWKLPERPRGDSEQEDGGQLALFSDPNEWEQRELPPLEREDNDPAHDATERGTLVHRVLEWLRDPADTDDLIRRALAERKIAGSEADRWFTLLKQDITTYTRSPLFHQIQAAADTRSEMMFRLTFGPHSITGVLDKVIRHPDGTAKVIDFKTNRLQPGDTRALKRAVHHYTPQLQLYTLVVQRLLGWDATQSVLYFTALDQEADIPAAEADLQACDTAIRTALDHIAAHDGPDSFPQAPDEHPCRSCGYRTLCKGN